MKIKAACIGTPQEVVDAFSSNPFAASALMAVGEKLGIHDILSRPAEYYVQKADVGPAPRKGIMGVEVRISGVSRDGRTPKQFHDTLIEIVNIVRCTIEGRIGSEDECQIFCVIMLDGAIEVSPSSGLYSVNVESKPTVVRGLIK